MLEERMHGIEFLKKEWKTNMKKNDKKIVMGIIAMVALVALALMIILWPKGGDPSLDNSTGSTSSTQGDGSIGSSDPATDPSQGSSGTTEPDPTQTDEDSTKPTDTEPVETDPAPTEPPVTDPDPTEHSHSYTSAATAATCTAGGYTTYTCSCGHSYRGNETGALGHSYTSTVVQPTYTTQGYTQHTCSRCGNSYKDSYTPVLTQPNDPSTHTHSYTRVVTAPTCTQEGYTTYTCACGHSYKGNYEDPRHKNTWVDYPPTCTEKGYTQYECQLCGQTKKGDYIAELGHSYGSWTTTKQPTQTEQGLQERVCATCGGRNTQVIPAIGAEIETYIDPRITVSYVGNTTGYSYGQLKVTVWATWDVNLSIYINEDGSFDITYYKQDGTRVDETLVHWEGYYWDDFRILEDGSYIVARFDGFES